MKKIDKDDKDEIAPSVGCVLKQRFINFNFKLTNTYLRTRKIKKDLCRSFPVTTEFTYKHTYIKTYIRKTFPLFIYRIVCDLRTQLVDLIPQLADKLDIWILIDCGLVNNVLSAVGIA